MSLSLVCRATRPSPLAEASTLLLLRHSSSLAAIKRGLILSEKARPQGSRLDKDDDSEKPLNYAQRQQRLEELRAQRPTYKIMKGKRDITEYLDQPKRKSRKARFYDPDDPFGKKSLVYQLQKGTLQEQLRELAPPDDKRRPGRASKGKKGRTRDDKDDDFDIIAELSRPWDPNEEPRRERKSVTNRRTEAQGSARRKDADEQPWERFESRPRNGSDAPKPWDKPEASKSEPPKPRDKFEEKEQSANRRASSDQDSFDDFQRASGDDMSVVYTTAASQFLYGTSVVEAALRANRRKLYRLYVYGPPGVRRTDEKDRILSLARHRDVWTRIYTTPDAARLFNKMSESRPHNGVVLEASPLPQPPLSALGPLPADYDAKPGYTVTLAHQSKEEAAINGTDTFYPVAAAATATSSSFPTPHKPLILVLDRIVDPGNLGAILRSASFLGATAVGIIRGASAPLTPVALKASAGTAETMTLFTIPSVPDFLSVSKANGWRVFAAVAPERISRRNPSRAPLTVLDIEQMNPLKKDPCVLLLGNEGEGLSPHLIPKADYRVTIPNLAGAESVDSLNVGVAAGLLTAAFTKGVMKARVQKEKEDVGVKVMW
ncbi:hypothetical protein VTJ04DRAFT_9916 [Mycothermus thermophilus]|uniref:uncharacterized protein n=1 Tax=Humicola insolens TaxID=85995 RepID=UPI003743654E